MNASKMCIIFFLALINGCDTAANFGPENPPAEGTVVQEGMEYRIALPKSRYLLTDTINGRFTVTNRTGAVNTFFFANVQQWGFRLMDAHGNIPLFYPAIVSPATSTMVLQDEESREFELHAVFKDLNGAYINRQGYILSAYLLGNVSPSVTVSIAIE